MINPALVRIQFLALLFFLIGIGETLTPVWAAEPARLEIEGEQWVELTAVAGATGEEQQSRVWDAAGELKPNVTSFTDEQMIAATPVNQVRRFFLMRAKLNDDVSFTASLPSAQKSTLMGQEKNEEGIQSLVLIGDYLKDSQFTSIQLKLAAGPWETLASSHAAGGVDNGYLFEGQAVRNDVSPSPIAFYPDAGKLLPDLRMIAETQDHELKFPEQTVMRKGPRGLEINVSIAKDPRGHSETYHLQKRDYSTFELQNVPLNPGQETSLQFTFSNEKFSPENVVPLQSLINFESTPLVARLNEEGAYVELVGITDRHGEDGWWQADGTEISPITLTYKTWLDNSKQEDRRLECLFKLHAPKSQLNGNSATARSDTSLRGTMKMPAEEPDGEIVLEIIPLLDPNDSQETFDVTLEIPLGEWEEVRTFPAAEVEVDESISLWNSDSKVEPGEEPQLFINRFRENEPDKSDYVTVVLIMQEDPDFYYQIVGISNSGEEISSTVSSGRANYRSFMLRTARFEINKYLVQRKPLRVPHFRNLAPYRNIPSPAYVVSPLEWDRLVAEYEAESQPELFESRGMSYVLHTTIGKTVTYPHDPALENRLKELHKRGVRMNYREASKELKQRIVSEASEDEVERLGDLNQLKELEYIGWRKAPAHEIPILLRNIAGLDQLSLYSDATADQLAVLRTLPDVKQLNMTARKAGPELFTIVGGMRDLEELDLGMYNRNLPDKEFARHMLPLRNLKKLTHLEMNETQFKDEMMPYLSGLTALEMIYTDYSPEITDQGLVHLKNLKNLDALVFHRTMATDAGLKHLEGLSKLEWLRIASTRFTDAGMSSLVTLPSLRRVDLSGSQVTDAGATILAQAPRLSEVNLNSTRVTETGIATLKAFHPKITIRHSESGPPTDSHAATGLAITFVPQHGQTGGALTLTDNFLNALKKELAEEGPQAAHQRNQDFQWFSLSDQSVEDLITAQHAGQRYALLPTQSDWIMRDYLIRPDSEKMVLPTAEQEAQNQIVFELSERDAEKLRGLIEQFADFPLAITWDDELMVLPESYSWSESQIRISGSWTAADLQRIQEKAKAIQE